MNNLPDYKVKIAPGFFDRIRASRPIPHKIKLIFFLHDMTFFGLLKYHEWTETLLNIKFELKNDILRLQPCYVEPMMAGTITMATLLLNNNTEITFNFTKPIYLTPGESLTMDCLQFKLK